MAELKQIPVVFARRRPHKGGLQYLIRFPNGYGASVIKNSSSYGGPELWEIAVVLFDGTGIVEHMEFSHIVYNTGITNDVIGWLTWEQVGITLEHISLLNPAAPVVTGLTASTVTVDEWKQLDE